VKLRRNLAQAALFVAALVANVPASGSAAASTTSDLTVRLEDELPPLAASRSTRSSTRMFSLRQPHRKARWCALRLSVRASIGSHFRATW